MSDYEYLPVGTVADVLVHVMGLIQQQKPQLALRLLEQLHERLEQDDAWHYRLCLAELGGEHVVHQ